MSECISSWQNLEEEQIAAAQRIGEQAVDQVDQIYGSGYPLWTPGSCELAYHNGHHGREVGNAALKLCSVLGLSRIEGAVMQAAGNAHDIVQLKGRGTDEGESADWLDARLAEAGIFDSSLHNMGKLAIIGTEPLFEEGRLVAQRAIELDYPTKAAELAAKSVACADLGELRTPQGPYLGHKLFEEIHGGAPTDEASFAKVTNFQRNQVRLIDEYEYPLNEANTLLATHHSEVARYSQEVLDALEIGRVNSWDVLLRHDLAFLQQPESYRI